MMSGVSIQRPVDNAIGVAVVGFSRFERAALLSSLAAARLGPVLCVVDDVARADVVVADSDDSIAIESIVGAGRLHQTMFVGARAPTQAMAWIHRPLDTRRVVRGLAALIALDADEIVTPRASWFGALCD